MQTPCEVFEVLARKRAAIQSFLVAGLHEPAGRRRCRLLEESVVLDRSARLVDAFLRAVRAEAQALGDFVARLSEDARREGFSPLYWLRAVHLLEQKVLSLLREEAGDQDPTLARVSAVFEDAKERARRAASQPPGPV